MNTQLRIIALVATATALLLLGGPQAAQAAEPRTIRIYAEFFDTTPAWWGLRGAVRDWDRAPGLRVVLVRRPGPGVITVRESTEAGTGYFELATWSSFDDGDEVWLDFTQAQGRDRTFRRSVACYGIGLLVEDLPVYQNLGAPTISQGWSNGSCMDPEVQYLEPLPVEMSHPSALDLRLAR